ncbi:MAG: amidohydrolase family protein [Coriobacteriaceae bacterium]|jgi:predicted TIM-barrel fold metal-dependent hydrolase|nr:amidohydrolase family protein [Coriobacteriaceae bacterium]
MPAIDVHAHIYPKKIAAKAVDSVGEFYRVPMAGKGTADALLEAKEQAPIDSFVIHSVAVKPGTVESINDFIAEECRQHPEFIGIAAMHQDYLEKEKEVERIIALGLKGIKIHPDIQGVALDDPRLLELYEMIEGRLPIILHTGDYRYDYSHPRRLKKVLHDFPDLVVDAAHLGGWSIYDIAYDYLEHENCFLDVSSSMANLGDRRTKELVEAYGFDRVMFGSDFPMWDPAKEYARFAGLGFPDEAQGKMFYGNARRFLGLTQD